MKKIASVQVKVMLCMIAVLMAVVFNTVFSMANLNRIKQSSSEMMQNYMLCQYPVRHPDYLKNPRTVLDTRFQIRYRKSTVRHTQTTSKAYSANCFSPFCHALFKRGTPSTRAR